MQCSYPRIRAETHETYINKKGGKSYKVEWLGRDIWDEAQRNPKTKRWLQMKYRKVEPTGCGQCTACRLNYARDKATLLMMEKLYHGSNTCWFITLTYKDEMLYFHTYKDEETGKEYTGASLNVEHTQLFFYNLRKKFKTEKISYVIAGEYGSQTMRPHYHIIIFGLPLDISKFELWSRNEWNQPVWRCKELEEIWADKKQHPQVSRGMVTVGEVTWESCAYVARYSLKKQDNSRNKEWYYLQGLIPEFIHWSNGIGKQYWNDHTREIIENDAVPVKNKKTGQLVKPPMKFYKYLGDYYPEVKELIKEKRIESGYAQTRAIKSDLSDEEYRIMSDKKIKSEFKDIRRKV